MNGGHNFIGWLSLPGLICGPIDACRLSDCGGFFLFFPNFHFFKGPFSWNNYVNIYFLRNFITGVVSVCSQDICGNHIMIQVFESFQVSVSIFITSLTPLPTHPNVLGTEFLWLKKRTNLSLVTRGKDLSKMKCP